MSNNKESQKMKMLKYKNVYIPVILVLFLSCFLNSCEEEQEETEDSIDQLFRPVLFEADINANVVTFTWVPIANASYSLEISRDSLLFQNSLQVIPLDGVEEYTVSDLYSNSRYSARIKAVSKVDGVNDSEYKIINFKTGTENIFYSVADGQIGTDKVLLKWNSAKDVSKIVCSSAGTADVTFTLSASDKSAGQFQVSGLNSGTAYTFKIYLGEMLRGTVSATTKSE